MMPERACGDHDGRKRHVNAKMATKAAAAIAQSAGWRNARVPMRHCRVQDDGDDGRLDAVQRRGNERHVAVRDVEPRQRDEHDEHDERRQHEQCARAAAAPRAMQQPADVGGELLRFGPGQHHAVVERVEEPAFRDPAALVDQLAMHDGDLPGRAAEADAAEAQPVAQRLGFGRRARRRFGHAARRNAAGLQVCVSSCASRHQANSAS
jgi:hypothetical protein